MLATTISAIQMKISSRTKKAFVMKQYHGAFAGTTKFEGKSEVLKEELKY